MSTWREELHEVIKTRDEREAEELARKRQRIAEALEVAADAQAQAVEGLRFAVAELAGKGQPAELAVQGDEARLKLHALGVDVVLDRDNAIVKIAFNQGKPREFDFGTDRHLAPKDVEEYVGRRLVELARAAQKEHPW